MEKVYIVYFIAFYVHRELCKHVCIYLLLIVMRKMIMMMMVDNDEKCTCLHTITISVIILQALVVNEHGP